MSDLQKSAARRFIVARTGNVVLATFTNKAAAERHAAAQFSGEFLRHAFRDGMVQFGRREAGRGIVDQVFVCREDLARRCGWDVPAVID
jgi:hypothetical protein